MKIGHQGDVLLIQYEEGEQVDQIFNSKKEEKMKPTDGFGYVLQHGEATGNTHRVEDIANAQVFVSKDQTELKQMRIVTNNVVNLFHEEHKPIEIKPKTTTISRTQREMFKGIVRPVID